MLQKGSHCKFDLKYHFVWCLKYRKMVLKKNISNYTVKVIKEIAERYDFEIIELAVMSDHVHMFVSAPPDVPPSQIIQIVKSITANKIFSKFPSIKKQLWGGALWERGYFAMSSGTKTTDKMIRQYIKEQKLPKASNPPNLFG